MTSESVQLARLKEQIEKKRSSQPSEWHLKLTEADRVALRENLPTILFICLALFSIGTYIAYCLTPSKNTDDLLDFTSYALPSLAAVAAGLNISLRREALWFWVSGTLVFGGLVVYVLKNGMLGRGLSQFVYFIGMAAIITMVITASKLQNGQWKRKSWLNPVFGWITIILATVQCTLVLTIEREPQPPATVQELKTGLQCHKLSGDLQGALFLMCTKER